MHRYRGSREIFKDSRESFKNSRESYRSSDDRAPLRRSKRTGRHTFKLINTSEMYQVLEGQKFSDRSDLVARINALDLKLSGTIIIRDGVSECLASGCAYAYNPIGEVRWLGANRLKWTAMSTYWRNAFSIPPNQERKIAMF